MSKLKILFIAGIVIVAVMAASFLIRIKVPETPRTTEPSMKGQVVWKEDFESEKEKTVPSGWRVRGKSGAAGTDFTVQKDPESGANVLHMEADKASGTIITRAEGVDLKEAPIVRWKWKGDKLPAGGAGREDSKDDQAIGIYVGSGGMLSNKSVSYRWDTVTPKGSEGDAAYAGGIAKIRWLTLRNEEDGVGKWIVEERDVAKDFKEAWGYIPETVYVSVCSNSQYTGTEAEAALEWIEFVSADNETEK